MYKTAILIMSDKGAAGEREDRSGKKVMEMLGSEYEITYYEIIPDEVDIIVEKLCYLCDNEAVNLILTSGGTGLTKRDVTPQATSSVLDFETPGISDAIRSYGLQKTPKAMLSRAVSGVRKKTLIINMPGSVKGVRESIEAILPALGHGLDTIIGKQEDCGEE